MADQKLLTDLLKVKGDCSPLTTIEGMDGLGRRTWLHATGRIDISYTATAAIDRAPTNIAGLGVVPHADLPPAYIQYLMPSRYCPSDKHENFVTTRFDGATKGDQILQMATGFTTISNMRRAFPATDRPRPTPSFRTAACAAISRIC